MMEFLRLWVKAVRYHSPSIPIAVIPFGDKTSTVEAFCSQEGLAFPKEKHADWLAVGERLYGAEDYRPGTPARFYFSKLLMFNGPFEVFVFLDANAILCAPIDDLEGRFRASGYDAVFRFRARPFRNIATQEDRDWLNRLNPEVGDGFNANFVVSRKGLFSPDDPSLRLDGGWARNKLGRAPEQSFLTRAIALRKLKVGTVHPIMRDPIGVSARNTVEHRDNELWTDKGVRIMFVKWNGVNMSDEQPNADLFSFFLNKYG